MMENSPPKSGTGAWKSIDDAFESWLSVAQIKPVNRSGKKKSAAEIYGYRTQPSTSQNQNVDEDETKSEEEETVQETPVYGLGRGRFLKQQEQKCPIEQLDETIHNELKALFGSGNSNEAIERHFATACSSSSEASAHDTRAFFKPPPYSEEHKNEEIEIVFGESNIMKKIRAQEALSSCTQNLESSKKRSPKCRNALVLSLTQKKTSNETEQDTKQVPELKGPDLFLSNKSYSNVTSAASSSSCNQADEPVFNEENFPAL